MTTDNALTTLLTTPGSRARVSRTNRKRALSSRLIALHDPLELLPDEVRVGATMQGRKRRAGGRIAYTRTGTGGITAYAVAAAASLHDAQHGARPGGHPACFTPTAGGAADPPN